VAAVATISDCAAAAWASTRCSDSRCRSFDSTWFVSCRDSSESLAAGCSSSGAGMRRRVLEVVATRVLEVVAANKCGTECACRDAREPPLSFCCAGAAQLLKAVLLPARQLATPI